jgi:DNA-binding MarR family transcriptional regulator
MSKLNRKTTAISISHLMPNIIQGAHLGVLSSRMVTQSQFLILLSVHARGACAMNTLSDHMKVSSPTMSGMVNRLVKAQYLKRVPNKVDRRQIMIELTPKGQKFLNEFKAIITKRWEDVLKVLSDEEVLAFHHIIVKLNESLKLRE